MQTAFGNNPSKPDENAPLRLTEKMAESIDHGLSAAMPESIKELIYQEIIFGYRVDPEKFVTDPKILQTCFDDILGDSGSRDVQRHIIEELERSFDLEFSSEDLSLSQALSELQLKIAFQ